jgi:hypothetical protein
LNYFCIEKKDNHFLIDYVAIPKTPERELTWLQRLVTLGKTPKPPEVIPARTEVELLSAIEAWKAVAANAEIELNAACVDRAASSRGSE